VVARPPSAPTAEAGRSFYLAPWRIDVTHRAGITRLLPYATLTRLAASALTFAGAPAPASLSVILTNDEEIEPLNEQHMHHDGPTDVLSFPLLPPSAFPGHPGKAPDSENTPAVEPFYQSPRGQRPNLGDIVISVERAIEQAPDGPADELRQLLVHGVLHICGWDHAKTMERDAMRALEREIMGK
jgi:probable rRNA maturation factor